MMATETLPVISGWGITHVKEPAWKLLGPWQPAFGGEVRDYGLYDSLEDAQAARTGHYAHWEIVETIRTRTEIWRNYEDGTLAVKIPAPFEWEAERLGYDFEWVSGSWARAIPK